MPESLLQMDLSIAQKESWRLFKIISEFVEGFETFGSIGPFISIFGSSRLSSDHPYYKLSYETTTKIAQNGFGIMTGAGPSLMEAANKAAQDSQKPSAGLIPDLTFEPEPNQFLDPKLSLRYRYFFIRKVMFVRYAQGFVFLPGGYGTMDELFEVLNLVLTKKIIPVPVYLMGHNYWKGLIDWLQHCPVREGCLTKEETRLFTVTDDPDEVAHGLLESYQSRMKIQEMEES
jgi:uncharacterized protein (TIGR00730 family)